MSASCEAFPDANSNLFPAVKQGIIRGWKQHLSEWAQCQKPVGGSGTYFTKKGRVETLQPGWEFDDFQPRLENCIFKCISWLQAVQFYWSDDRSFVMSRDLSNGTNVASWLSKFIFCLHIYIQCSSSAMGNVGMFLIWIMDVLIVSTTLSPHLVFFIVQAVEPRSANDWSSF